MFKVIIIVSIIGMTYGIISEESSRKEKQEILCTQSKVEDKGIILSWSKEGPVITNTTDSPYIIEHFLKGSCYKGSCKNYSPLEVQQIPANTFMLMKKNLYFRKSRPCSSYSYRAGFYIYTDKTTPYGVILSDNLVKNKQ